MNYTVDITKCALHFNYNREPTLKAGNTFVVSAYAALCQLGCKNCLASRRLDVAVVLALEIGGVGRSRRLVVGEGSETSAEVVRAMPLGRKNVEMEKATRASAPFENSNAGGPS